MYSIEIETFLPFSFDKKKLKTLESECFDDIIHQMADFELKHNYYTYSYSFKVNGKQPNDVIWDEFHEKLIKFKKIQSKINSLNQDFV